MAPLPVEILFGIYLGILTGIIPGLAAWGLGFVFKYFTGVTIPGFGVVVLAVALAGVNGGLLALADPTITESANAVTVTTAILVVLMISLYAHSRGDAMGATFPKRLSFRQLRDGKLVADVRGSIAGRDEVRVRVVGDVADMEGYPPLPDELREEIRHSEWAFPADLRIHELEERLAERLESEFDLGDAAVSIDERGRASVVAAPSFSGLSKRIPDGERAVSVDALVPTGVARGDEVTLITADAQVRGTVVSARTRKSTVDAGPAGPVASADGDGNDASGAAGNGAAGSARTGTGGSAGNGADADADGDGVAQPVRAPTTAGGEGRITVAVTRTDAEPLLRADRARVVVESRGIRREYELISLLRRAGRRFARVTVGAGGPLDGADLERANVRDAYGVAVVAVRGSGGWTVAPRGERTLSAGDEVFAVGTRDRLTTFEEAVV